MTQSTDPNELRTYAFKLRRNNPESWSHKAAADTLDECALRIEKTEAEVEALRKALHQTVLALAWAAERNAAFDDVYQAVSDALAARPGGST